MQSCFRQFSFTVLLLVIRASPTFSQAISFNKVILNEESINVISSMTQDHQGNIWIGASVTGGSGLFIYDGFQVKSINNQILNHGSLTTGRVECLYTDRIGNIWVGTFGAGLEKFDPKTGNFTHYTHDDKDSSSISGDIITAILEDHEGLLWIGTDYSGLNRMDSKSGKFTHFRHQKNDPNSLSFDQVRVIYEDKENVLWIGTGAPFAAPENPDKKGGLNRFNKKTGQFTRYLHDEKNPNSLVDDRVRAILEDSYGNFWVGTAGDGLHTMDRVTGKFERHTYDPVHADKLSRPSLKNNIGYAEDHITFIAEDSKKTIWIGTFENGMMRYDPATKKMTHYAGQKDSVGNFTDSTTWCMFTSREGVIWMSTWTGGLYRFDPSHQNIFHNSLLNGGGLNSFLEEPRNIQYFGTDSGVLRIDSKNNISRLFVHDAKKQESISSNVITVLYKDRENRIWVGTPAGLNLFNPEKQSFTAYKHNPKISGSLTNDVIIKLYEDEQSNFWVGTVYGFDRMDIEKGEFSHFKPFPKDTVIEGKNFLSDILEDSRHNLWMAFDKGGGLHIFNPKTGNFKNYLSGHSVICICQDGYDKLWVGAEDGLYSYNRGIDSFSLFIDPSTGSSLITHGIVESNDKSLWITSPAVIYKINKERNVVSRFGKGFGVIGNIGYATSFKTPDGMLIFGNGTGYYSLYPDQISSNAKPPEIALTEFRIADRIIKPEAGGPFGEDLLQAKQIELNHDQDVFSFVFNVVHYTNPEANKVRYKLGNYDKDWRPAGSDRTAFYYNVPPGQYYFQIIAQSSEGVWFEKSIDIIINPPWWRRWWAYCIYGLAVIAIVYSLHHIQKQRVIRAERERTRNREQAQAREIERAYNELKITQGQLIQSEKMASLGEMTAGIAHEIQNPLNFMNNFSEVNTELIDEMKEELKAGNHKDAMVIADNIADNELKINIHGRRADAIVKSMLQHSRTGSGKKEPTNINALADEYLRLAYHGLRAKDPSFNTTMKTDFDPGIGSVPVIAQDIGRVFLNLYNNAFYAVNEKKKSAGAGYEPTIWVSTRNINNSVEIIVKDNGSGIPSKVKDKIFQPFFTTKPTGQGTGLGLSLSYDIIKAHGGEIGIDSREGDFTEFVFQIPK
jgi:signal transduction histidine kinase/ligand-binding sensor domain-containing protein